MAHFRAEACGATTTTTGSGALTLATTAPAGHRTPQSAGIAVNDTIHYYVKHQTFDEWELGVGTYSATNTLTRTTVLASSNGGAAVTFSAGTKDVRLVQLIREFGGGPVENVPTGSPYTLTAQDLGKTKRVTDTNPQTINITTAFSGLGCMITWPASAGTITLDAGTGVNINGLGDGVNLTLAQAAGSVLILPTGAGTFDVIGAVGDLVVGDITNLAAGVASLLTAFSSANLFTALTTKTGSGGNVVFSTGATLSGTLDVLDALPGTNNTYQGRAIAGRNAGATIAQWQAVYLDAAGTWQLADANGTSTYPARGLAVAAGTSGNPLTVLTRGVARNDSWTWTPGGTIWLDTAAGGLTQTAPATGGDKKQPIGWATHADAMVVDPSPHFFTVA